MGKRLNKNIAVSDIKSLESEYYDRGKTVLLVGIFVAIILVFLSTVKQGTLVLGE